MGQSRRGGEALVFSERQMRAQRPEAAKGQTGELKVPCPAGPGPCKAQPARSSQCYELIWKVKKIEIKIFRMKIITNIPSQKVRWN